MPSYPIRPTFPIDLRSPSGILVFGRQGGAVMIDTSPSPAQFFAALEALMPGASAAVQAAVPSDPGDPTNRAFRQTNFVTPGCALLAFVTATLGLKAAQVTALLAQAALQPK